MFSFSSAATSLFAITAIVLPAYATPIDVISRQSTSKFCTPNFEGRAVSVSNSAREWGVQQPSALGASLIAPSFSQDPAEFHFQNTGSGDGQTFFIKDANYTSLVVTAFDDGSLGLTQIDYTGTTHSQKWNVLCDSCFDNVASSHGNIASGCNITSVPTGLCSQVDKTNSKYRVGAPLVTADCAGIDAQNFDFWTA